MSPYTKRCLSPLSYELIIILRWLKVNKSDGKVIIQAKMVSKDEVGLVLLSLHK